jgi:uncharacterized protein
MLISWDEHKAESNLKKHGISFVEAQTVLFAQNSVTMEDKSSSEDRFVTIAFSANLNLLIVVYAYRFEDEVRIISARKANKKEAKIYEKKL